MTDDIKCKMDTTKIKNLSLHEDEGYIGVWSKENTNFISIHTNPDGVSINTALVKDEKGNDKMGVVDNQKNINIDRAMHMLNYAISGTIPNSKANVSLVGQAMKSAGIECADHNGKVVAPVLSVTDVSKLAKGEVIQK